MVNVQWSGVQRSGLKWLAKHVLPASCVLCGDAGQADDLDLCAGCQTDLPQLARACQLCAEQLHGAPSQLICGACLRRPPRFHRTHCAFNYGYPVDHLVRALKYGDRLAYARVLGTLLAQSLAKARIDPWPECIIPIPLATKRFRERGFNQAMEVGKQLAWQLALPLRADVLVRRRDTREQAGLERDERRRNVRGAFALLQSPQAKHVAILDDVVTTGSTANEVARVLKRAKVERIEVWAVARASK